ncbi:hypothetical protein SAMN05444280_14416 [Tangfeifania diversioriginum]|uniref:DUF354 domain-containing protein n=1 Tax=Tangfeifania diversioriginum TaxID=1168035 RepID=A0A1M6NNE7_9BACT|nr:DUF354 domain-containing protein [Tangfeifania diversioriginum]SHJ97215.1 hypothetical protein SAMN05444280_14416 [Tangfeifania diversioriginum]
MRILIDIGHPAHVHYFRNFIKIMEAKGHNIFVVARDRECILDLLRTEEIAFFNRGKGASTLLGKILYVLQADLILLWQSLRFKPDLFLSHGSHYTMHIARLLKKPCIATGDSDHIKLNAKFLMPYLSDLLTPSVYKLNYGKKHIYFNAYMELLYLHRKYFQPQISIKKQLGINEKERFFLLRFVAWDAFHDSNQGGLSSIIKYKLIEKLSKHGRVIISSEGELPKKLRHLKANFKPYQFHDILAAADLCISEGATTASEAAILGTPVIYINSLQVTNCREQEDKYRLCYNYYHEEGLLDKVSELLQISNLKNKHLQSREKMLADKIDPTAFLTWFIENYPESQNIMRENPEYQNRFKG